MKLISQKQLIELLPAKEPTDDLLRAFESFTPMEFRQPGHCARMVRNGLTQPLTVSFDSIPAFLITYHITDDGGLWLDIAQTLRSGAPTAALVDALDLLAKQTCSRYVRFSTKRRGLVKLGNLNGYKAEGVIMCKEVVA